MFRRLRDASIWAEGAVPLRERKYAYPLKRFVFPAFDIAMMVLAWQGLQVGLTAVKLTFPDPLPLVLYGALGLSAFVCLLACHFPRLWVVEAIGKSVILGSLAVLLIAMLVAAAEVPGHTGTVIAPLFVVSMLVVMLGLWLLGRDAADRRNR